MATITAPAKTAYMLMSDILCLLSADAWAEADYRQDGMSRDRYSHLPLTGLTVADILPFKRLDIDQDTDRYDALRLSMQLNGQTAPIAVNMGYLLNGGHRVAIAIELGWPGLTVSSDHEASEDRTWNAANKSLTFA